VRRRRCVFNAGTTNMIRIVRLDGTGNRLAEGD
jgi:hypothetical protein